MYMILTNYSEIFYLDIRRCFIFLTVLLFIFKVFFIILSKESIIPIHERTPAFFQRVTNI